MASLTLLMCEAAPIYQLNILKLINEINSQQKLSLTAISSLHDSVWDDDKIFSKLNLPTQTGAFTYLQANL